MRAIVEFINHGLLPFVGRAAELERLMEFWRSTVDSYGLRVGMLLGEAGIGKSRLIEQLTGRITAAGGVVSHVKIYPESASSLLPQIARSLMQTGAGRQLLKKEPDESLAGVADALRKLSRLRATLLVVEDAHLLLGDPLNGFSALLHSLSDESLSVLCVARPVELPVRSVIDPYLTQEATLGGLNPEDIRQLWGALFGQSPDDDVLAIVEQSTVGNALALRSALRSAMKSGIITQTSGSDRWYVSTPNRAFAAALKNSAQLLTGGMTSNLTAAERDWAAGLACLGEVFAVEAASALLDDAPGALRALAFKGIIAPTSFTPAPVTQSASAGGLYAFTHSLLHRHFIQDAAPEHMRLAALFIDCRPLYSVVPFDILSDRAGQIAGLLTPEQAEGLIRGLMQTGRALEQTPDWALSERIWNVGQALFQATRSGMNQAQGRLTECRLLNRRLWILRRMLYSHLEEFTLLLDRFSELTADPEDLETAEFRATALGHLCAVNVRNPQLRRQIAAESGQLFERFGQLYTMQGALNFLRDAIYAAKEVMEYDTVALYERRVRDILANPEFNRQFGSVYHRVVMPQLMLVFSTSAELDERMKLLAELEHILPDNREFIRSKITFYQYIGHTTSLLELIQTCRPLFERYGYFATLNNNTVTESFVHALRGMPLGIFEQRMDAFVRSLPGHRMGRVEHHLAENLIEAALLCCNNQQALHFADRFSQWIADLTPVVRLMLAVAGCGQAGPVQQPDPDVKAAAGVPHLIDLLCGEPLADTAVVVQQVLQAVSRPVVRTENVLELRVVADALLMAARQGYPDLLAQTRPALEGALEHAMEWLGRPVCQMAGVMSGWLQHFGQLFSAADQQKWQQRISAMPARWNNQEQVPAVQGSEPSDQVMVLTMLGTVSVAMPGAQPVRLRGARICALLGAMVADRMLAKPLDTVEFNRIATGEDDPEHARKILKVALFRVREATAPDAVLSDGDNPRLNSAKVRVDILEAHRLLDQASSALSDGMLLKAVPLLMHALQIVNGEVPFPTLYDTFFEAMREDFESAQRDLVMRASRLLLREGDPAAAAELSDLALRSMPEDEELTEILAQALLLLGKNAEAQRLKLRESVGGDN